MAIIVGYQGVGKSTLAGAGNGFIDLESSSFWVNGQRDPNWPKVYADIAMRLSQQGYHVFTASHAAVREELRNHPAAESDENPMGETIAVVYPMPSLREQWVQKLKVRYEHTKLDKDFKAWRNAHGMYFENIQELSDEQLPMVHIPIYSMEYSLEELLKERRITRK